MKRDIDLERQIGIRSIIHVHRASHTSAEDCISEWEIEAAPDATRTAIRDYCRQHICGDGISYNEWILQNCPTMYEKGYYRLYKGLGNIWTYRVFTPY